jgi:DNA-binding transcriptional ArsR family regulator
VNTYHEAQLDALGDATRRAILARLLNGPLPVGELARDFPVSRPAISQHLRVLKHAHLVTDRAAGTRRVYALNPDAFDSLREYSISSGRRRYAFKKRVEKQSDKEDDDDDDRTDRRRAVRKSIVVKASGSGAFKVFAEARQLVVARHHIGNSPLKTAIIQGAVGGRC